jgi:apolipoprotein D and lipocalin family protein
MIRPLFVLWVAVLLCGCGALSGSYRDQSVMIASSANFDPSRYLGRWYEVARYPNPFQADCAGSYVDYQAGPGGQILVRNSCLDASGAVIAEIGGTAQVAGPGRLSVRLDGVPVAAPYWVLWVDEGYRTAVVGQPNGRAGWVLNREPEIPQDRWVAAREVLDFNGYDLSRLVRSVSR